MKYVVLSLLAVFLVMVVTPFTVVTQTERAVILHWGVVDRVLQPGIHWVTPIAESVQDIDVSVQALEIKELAYSKDGQTIEIAATINYQIDPLYVDSLYKEVRKDAEERYVMPKSKNSIKTVISRYTAQGIIDNRGNISTEVQKAIEQDLAANYILVKNVSVTNYDFDDKYEAAIADKQVQEQQALAQANITKQEEEKKKQEILKAEALAETSRLQAEALASSNGEKVIAKIYAEAALEQARQWDGKLPTNVYTGAPLPILNVTQ
jgi:regulator of protease activity HflC (stomatin/prohibitin superfamily)